jgi:hypothetical protein
MPMALLAQLPHHGPALDFGDPGLVLHLFQCATAGCSTWRYDKGCNAAFMLSHETLGEGLTQAPQAATERPVNARVIGSKPAEQPSMHGELWLTGWQEHEDIIPQHMRPAYFDPRAFYALPEEFQFPHDFDARLSTKAGGVPYWTGNGPTPHKIPPSPRPFDYLMQIDTNLFIQGRLPDPSAIGCDVHVHRANGEIWETLQVPGGARRENAPWMAFQGHLDRDDEYYVEFANFGSDGTAYVFIDRETTPPEAVFFWNR